ncbi:MAG: putative PhoH-like protein [Prokaryotic dsDNA virus sp.]|jgi:phosphate starvation-inducible PhoH-like protein|nr:MAG: putative PhoH-like protein [Prokaryotic dsDNA virus sp.]|tara:strand:- start:3708 stop:4364 length:657 start_codon:yes stop_codon:yes gene_type:complete
MENKSKKPPKGSVKFNISLSEEQKRAKEQMIKHPYSFVVGKAGSGKTLLAVQVALDMFFKRQYNKIIITRPTVATEDNGFLPGTEKEKLEPWLVPIMSNMRKVYNKPDKIAKMVEQEEIELVSLAHFRGRTFDGAVVIVDEFQNLTKAQLRMALGRLGKDSIMIFCGDNQQIDLSTELNSAIDDVHKIKGSDYVFKVILEDNHRNKAIDDVLKLLTGY